MDPEVIRRVLLQVTAGELSVDAATAHLTPTPLSDLGYATVDLERQARCGFPEVIFCQGKTAEWIEGVARKLLAAGQSCLGTRVNDEQASYLAQSFPEIEQDRLGRTFWVQARPPSAPQGRVAVIAAGTADLPVAREASVTANKLGCQTVELIDVGVAGLHRLLRQQTKFVGADVVIVVAGMEGALPSVVGGLVDCPVIAVPTSIGYGASLGGLSALLTMLNSCAAGVVTVNIDAGFKAGYVAAQIVRKIYSARS